MNKVYQKVLVIAITLTSLASFAQTTIKLENFDGVVPSALPAGVTSASLDWITDNGGVPTCNVAGSSAANVLAATCTGAIEEVVFGPFDATFFTTMKVSWNGYRTLAGGAAPTLSLSFSTGGAYTNIPFTDVFTNDTWEALTPVSIPAGADHSSTLSIKLSYDVSTGTNGSFIAFDDWFLQGAQTPVYYWDGSGFLNNTNSWSLNTNGVGAPHPADFTTASQIFNIVNGTSATINGPWSVSGSGAQVVVGDGATWNPNFTVPSTNVFSVASGSMLTVSNNATLTLQNSTLPTTSGATFTTGSTVNYAQGSVVNIIRATHSNLTISGGFNKNQASSLVINGILNLNGANLQVSNSALNTLTITGTVSGSGALQTTSNSNVKILGTGACGTVTFSSTTSPIICRSLVLNRTSSGTVILGSDLKVNTLFTHTAGSLDINGKTLTLNTAATFPTSAVGVLKGSSTSTLKISGAITNNLFMDQTSSSSRTLKVFVTGNSVTLGNALEITDSVKVSAGTLTTGGFLTLKSTPSLKARIAQIGGAVTGNITVEMYVPGSVGGWKNLGAPGISGLTVASWDGGSGSATGFAMTCTGCINTPAAAGGGTFVSIQADAAGNGSYTAMTSGSALTPGTGVWVYDANSLTTAIDVTMTKSGSVVTGNVASGTGFMANPYPCPIDQFRMKANHPGLGAIDIYNPITGTFQSFNGGVPSSAIIPMGQGFYTNGLTNFTFVEADKITGAGNNTSSILKTASNPAIGTVFQLDVIGLNGEKDETYLRFHGSATTGFDNDLDAYKRIPTPGYYGYSGPYTQYTTISTVNTGNDYAINSLPYALTSPAVIPVKVKVSTTGTYTIAPVDIANLPASACVTLKDKLLNVLHDLRTGSYICSINDTTSAARFELTICADITTGINNAAVNVSNTLINQDQNGAYVKTNFETSTKATISAFNVMGQKLMADKEIEGTELTTYLNLGDVHSQVVIIRVTSAKENTTKKIFIN